LTRDDDVEQWVLEQVAGSSALQVTVNGIEILEHGSGLELLFSLLNNINKDQ
jgi:hypothetical protein